MSIRLGLASRLAHLSLASSGIAMRVGRDMLPSRPAPSQGRPSFGTPSAPAVLHAANLIDCARVGGAVVSPDGSLACFSVRQYSWDKTKFDNQLFICDLASAVSLTDEERPRGPRASNSRAPSRRVRLLRAHLVALDAVLPE